MGSGQFVSDLPFFGGLMIWKNPQIVDKLGEVGALLSHERDQSQLHALLAAQDAGDLSAPPRSGSSAWTASPDKARRCASGRSKASRRPVFPGLGPVAPAAMIANRPDWCISRQRNWGVPILSSCFKGDRRTASANRGADGSGRQTRRRTASKRGSGSTPPSSSAEAADYDKISDTLDVWFDSGTTHWHVLRGSHPDGHPEGPRADLTSRAPTSIAAGSIPRC